MTARVPKWRAREEDAHTASLVYSLPTIPDSITRRIASYLPAALGILRRRSGSGVQSCATYPMSKARPSSVDSSASNREAIRSRSARQVRGPPGPSTRSSLSKTCSQDMGIRIRIIGPRDAYVLAALLCVQFSTRTNADESVRASGDANRRLHGSWSEWREASKRAVPT